MIAYSNAAKIQDKLAAMDDGSEETERGPYDDVVVPDDPPGLMLAQTGADSSLTAAAL